MTDKPNAQAFMEDVLLPELDRLIYRHETYGMEDTDTHNLKQFIQSRRSEWAQEEK